MHAFRPKRSQRPQQNSSATASAKAHAANRREHPFLSMLHTIGNQAMLRLLHSGQITVPPPVHEVLRSPGRPLEPDTRAFVEPHVGHDFSRVRVLQTARAQPKLTVGGSDDEFERQPNTRRKPLGKSATYRGGLFRPPA
jgi:hypothetical protein